MHGFDPDHRHPEIKFHRRKRRRRKKNKHTHTQFFVNKSRIGRMENNDYLFWWENSLTSCAFQFRLTKFLKAIEPDTRIVMSKSSLPTKFNNKIA